MTTSPHARHHYPTAVAPSAPAPRPLPLQYEALTAAEGPGMARSLREAKRFLGLDAKLPSDDLGMFNNRRQVEHVSRL